MLKKYSILLAIFLFSSCMGNKRIIGQTAIINLGGEDFTCLSRIDTGATSTSIHAENIQIEDGHKTHKKNIGKTITFDTINDLGIKKTITTKIVDVDTIRNSQGKESRYCIKIKVGWEGFFKEIEVNLRDRSKMDYKVLIGRKFLSNDFLVDVTKIEEKRN